MRVAGKHEGQESGLGVVRSAIRGVRWRLRATRRVWRRGATHAMPLLDTEAIPDGRIDDPERGKWLEREARTIRGWVTFPSGPCVRAEGWLGEETLGMARLGIARPDLGRQLGPGGAFSGFELMADLSQWGGRSGETVLRLVAFSESGERHVLL